MKKFFSFLLFLSMALPLIAASLVQGKIIDANTESPLDYVNVALFKQGDKVPVAGVSTDKAGVFSIPSIPDGKYSLRISFIGYKTVSQVVNVTGQQMNVGVIKLAEDSKRLADVEVVGQGSQMHFDVDKKVFSVDQNIAAAGGSATDVLKNIPSVKVDNDGNVSLRKDANVEVWINGKPSGLTADNRAQVLQQMPAESIQSIEIMTNPSAKFNPEGTAGIINLVLKKNRKAGYYGSVSSGLMYPDGGKLGSSLGANINYSSSKIDAYANIGYRAMNMQGGGWNSRYNLAGADTLSLLRQDNLTRRSFGGIFTRAGFDYHLDSLNTISLSGFGMAGSGNSNSNVKYLLTNITTNTVEKNYTRDNAESGTRPNYNVNLDYRHDFAKNGTNLLASISYSGGTRGGDNRYKQIDSLSTYTSDVTQTGTNSNKDFQFKVDYTNKLSETSRLESGWQSNVQSRLSDASALDNKTNTTINAYYNEFNYNEQIHAGYLTYGDRYGKLSLQAGMRAEYMRKESTYSTDSSEIAIPQKTYFQLFPSMYLSYTLAKNSELQLNYSRRVNRPRGRQINPFRDYSDSTNISYGNANLSPEFSSSLELNYMKTWENHSLSTSAYYRFTDNVIQNVRFLHAGTMENTFMNVAKKQNTGVEFVAKNQLFRILNLTSSLNLYYSKLNASVYVNPYDSSVTTIIPEQSSFSWSANVLANFMLSKSFSGQISGEYSSPRVIAQGTEDASYSFDLGLRKTFLDRKLSVSFNVRDILNSDRNKSTTSGAGFSQKSESYFHGRMFGVSVSYNFGNMKPKQADMKKKQGSADINMDMGD